MIYSPTKKVLIYCPFKNCSSSLQGYYSNKPQWHSAVGPNPDYNFNHGAHFNRHSAFVPESLDEDFVRYLPIRNPYDRVVSQYHWHLKKTGVIPFKEWLMVHSKQPVCMPVTTIYEKYDHLLKTETIEDDLREHELLIVRNGREVPFPWMNRTEDKLKMDISPEHEELIYFLHYSDFVAGGYPRLYK